MQTNSGPNLPQSKPQWEWIISIAIHALLLIGALFVVPFDQIIDRLTNPKPPTIAEERVEELAEFIEQTHERTVQIEVQRMDEILEQMRELRDMELEDTRPHEQQLISTSPQRALAAQRQAIEALDRAAADDASVDERVQAHAEAADAQQQADAALEAAGEPFADARREQTQATTESSTAEATTTAERKAQADVAEAERRLENETKRATDAADRAQKRQADADGHETRAQAAAESLTRAKLKSETAQAAVSEAGDDKKKQDAARRAAANAARDLERAETNAQRLRTEADKRRVEADKAIASATEAGARLDAARKEVADLTEQLKQNRTNAPQQTAAALKSQTRAMEALEHQIAGDTKPDVSTVARVEDVQVQVKTDSIPESVDSATKLEDAIAEAFRRMRAARQAQIRGVTIAEAEKSVNVVKPDRAPIDPARLKTDVRTSEQLEDYKKAVVEAQAEVRSMRELAETLLTDAISARVAAESGAMVAADASGDGTGAGKAPNAAARRAAALRAAGMEDAEGLAKDLTGIMSGKSGVAHVVGEGGHPTVPENSFALPIGTRRIGQTGRGAGWVYVDSWYVIGPWDNAGRRNTATQFPPEQIVDLDGRYTGKGGRSLSWVFHQESLPRLKPPNDEPYGIFYLYTELHFDAPAELWCAVGSDDNSNVWVNDFPVWVHAGPERVWAPAQGYRKVRFNAGVNKILFRLENGHRGSNWSFLIHLPNSANPPSLPRN